MFNETKEIKIKDVEGILEQIQDSYHSEVEIHKNSDEKYFLTFINEDNGAYFEVCLVFSNYEHYSQIGIHLRDVDEYSLSDALERAERDGFSKIYIHSIAEGA